MTFNKADLLTDLKQRTQAVLQSGKGYLKLDLAALNYKSTPESWSVLECMEHLNRYGDFYLPEIQERIRKAKTDTNTTTFKSGWLGNYFAKSMLPREQLNKMNTFKSMNPAGSRLDKATLEKFIAQQKRILDLLEQAEQVHLAKVKTSVSISKWIKLRLGDTLRVVIYHNQRHIVQADKALQIMANS